MKDKRFVWMAHRRPEVIENQYPENRNLIKELKEGVFEE